jgi:signal transduction histidine kinase
VLLALGAGLLGTALAVGSLVRVALRPLERLRGIAGDVASTADLSRRIPAGDGPEEVDALATDLNAMLARLETSATERETALESARRFAADAGHELRTPLTSLRANLDAVGGHAAGLDPDTRAALAACSGDAARLQALVEQLQALARGEAGPPANAEAIDLGELADAAILALRARHPEVTAELEAPAAGPLVRGDGESLRMLLDNLLENAAVHGRPGGRIVTTVTPSGALLVDDDGEGIPAEERAAVLERFARGSSARGPGTGLGLAIAAAQAARHGGSLALEDAPAGGLRAHVTLPVTPA